MDLKATMTRPFYDIKRFNDVLDLHGGGFITAVFFVFV
jgi:hypothetical protein